MDGICYLERRKYRLTLPSLIWIILALSIGFHIGDGSKITTTIEMESKPAGGTGMLNCTTNGRSRSKVIWQKFVKVGNTMTTVVYSMDERIMIANRKLDDGKFKYQVILKEAVRKGWTFTLVVRKLTARDAGTYQCMLMIDGMPHNRYPKATGRLIVQTPPLIDKTDTTSQAEVLEGNDVTLECKASGIPKPRISWSRPNGLPLPGGELTIFKDNLTLKAVQNYNSGLYRCKADNAVRPVAWYDVTVRVFHRPSVTAFRKTVGQTPEKNSAVEMSCIIRADPKPEMSWWRGNQRMLNNYRRFNQIFELTSGSISAVGDYMITLRIFDVESGDLGNYTCRAENRYGTNETTVKLFYTPTCQGPICVFENLQSSSCGHFDLSAFTLAFAVVFLLITSGHT